MILFAVGFLLGAVIGGGFMWRQRRRDAELMATLLERTDQKPSGKAPFDRLADGLYRHAEQWRAVADERTQLAARRLAVLDAVPLSIVVVDRLGERLIENRAAVGEFNRSHTGLLVTSAVDEVIADVLRSGGTVEQEVRLTGPPRRTLRIQGCSLGEDGQQQLGAAAYIIDDTALERVDEIRRDFVANLSHELKTPVGAIALLSETLRDETEPDVRDRLLHKTEAEAHRLAAIIDDLLELAELEATSAPLEAPVAIVDAVAEAIDQVAGAAHGAGRTVVADGIDQVKVVGDHLLIVSALVNLIENACKYSAPDTEVEVTTEISGPGVVDVQVIDSGIGIPQKHLDRIFERFYRVDRGRSRVTGGTGLGLSIVKHTVERMGGEVLVDSREGQGSTFTLRLQTVVDDR